MKLFKLGRTPVYNFNGWVITYSGSRPVTGRWLARKYGVQLGAHSNQALISMLRARAEDTSLNVR